MLRPFDRVLVPGGAIGLVWNFRDLAEPWQQELDALLAGLRDSAPHSPGTGSPGPPWRSRT